MSLIGPQAGQAGLALLLQPATGAVIMNTACTLVGTAYPVFASLKAVENDRSEEQHVQWLTYWSVYGTLSLIEGLSDKLLGWFPFYYHAKLGFLLWLTLPKFQGAKVLYKRFGRPLFLKYRGQIDRFLGKFQKQMETYVESQQNNVDMLKGAYDQVVNFVNDGSDSKTS
uniref:HVA22-like protein n=1 Tax=Tetraselmis sp. GSL018 TaxID=582737 RepID=A0A061S1L8_9CHLO|mmetsp:Transcript_37710/g.89570  ORF Transcript_37710/g.89570 Transcript_37710/m.89570 type:complete len:169 (+) Transcript_37710:118-624(+)|eukprot:CAMPEP_0177609186 /NCGR_PEP_ID=MMETSP0419_2-20121207/18927_1 /TAXON_ID=582737 /ORGANISM="Tetraselmis sp., Strain GSL018" /LENGTH=168 /DNA_ID=CAMNT_0019104039 /DNA_START=77 /DNA_END=583 /DNA_ORIENTATION=-